MLLPNGKEYCLELAKTENAQDDCAGDLEDGLFTANRALQRVDTMADKFVRRLKLQRNPCGFWKRTFKRSECQIE